MNYSDFKKEDLAWMSARVSESTIGRIIVPASVVNKYRKITSDFESCNSVARSRIINLIQEYCSNNPLTSQKERLS